MGVSHTIPKRPLKPSTKAIFEAINTKATFEAITIAKLLKPSIPKRPLKPSIPKLALKPSIPKRPLKPFRQFCRKALKLPRGLRSSMGF